jgi:hypothetical protein
MLKIRLRAAALWEICDEKKIFSSDVSWLRNSTAFNSLWSYRKYYARQQGKTESK